MINNLFNYLPDEDIPDWVDKSKIEKTEEKINGGTMIVYTYSGKNGYWQSSTWFTTKPKENKQSLTKQLEKAVKDEHFELASILRDKLKQIK